MKRIDDKLTKIILEFKISNLAMVSLHCGINCMCNNVLRTLVGWGKYLIATRFVNTTDDCTFFQNVVSYWLALTVIEFLGVIINVSIFQS